MKWVIRIAISVFVLVVLGVAALFAAGHRSSAGKIHGSVEVAATPAQVWTWISDGQKIKQWVSWTVDVKNTTPSFDGPGAKRVMVMKDENNGGMLMNIDATCLEYTAPRRLKVALSSPEEFDGEQVYRLTDLGNGKTRVEVEETFHFGIWLAQLFEPFITPAAQKKMDMDLAQLKALAERG